MSFFEKYTTSKFYYYIDQFFRILLTNFLTLLTIVFGLFIFGIGPAIIASTYITKMIFEKYDGPIFKVYIKIVREVFKKSLIITLSFTVIIGLLIFNTMFFFGSLEVGFTWLGFIGFMIMFLVLIISFAAYVHALLLASCYKESSNIAIIKNGYIVTMGFFLRSVIFTILTVLNLMLMLVVPILGAFISFFIEAIIIYFCFLKAYKNIPNFENRDDIVSAGFLR